MPAWLTSLSQSLAALLGVFAALEPIVTIGVLVYGVIIARDIRETIKARHLDGMKYVRDLIATSQSSAERKWVYDLRRESRPLSEQDEDRVRAICRDLDNIGLLCRKGLLPIDIVAETYGRNIVDMWSSLEPIVRNLRDKAQDPYYFLEFEWLAERARKVRDSILKETPAGLLRKWR